MSAAGGGPGTPLPGPPCGQTTAGKGDIIDLPVCTAHTPDEHFALTLHEVARGWRAKIDEQFRPMGLSSASWSVIFTLATAERPLSQREIADRIFVESPTVVRLLDRLEKLGWVRREPSPQDRRRNLVRLTAKILEHHDTMHAMAERVHREALAGIPADKLAVTLEVLETLRSRLCT
ncbi:MarR family transcriptional regulator [Desulfovibrio sulfodismutans]|uniref:MarR family transcriptional regulator n=1 Tax=Desulfolutivibrio sulfodismutans TaxID=63561 RepID=A0A7K3NSB8_9BACT|nr:MarR family transcriptional regulator [Desulfolutivibrio sulfodismutans]NDY58743.1 MarR family transcriptional regulator [Desulfolutivibrio sulfodismutans]QLA12750.1 MarR family transcriptional regulator [Desulfolutivibrio sulfodismutans DSM 3696]